MPRRTVKPINLSADGSTTPIHISGKYSVSLDGDLGGGVLAVERAHDPDETFKEFSYNGSYASTEDFKIEFAGWIRFTLSGATSPDLNIYIAPIFDKS